MFSVICFPMVDVSLKQRHVRGDVGGRGGRQWWMWQARVWLGQGGGGGGGGVEAHQPLAATPPQVRCRLVSSGDHPPAASCLPSLHRRFFLEFGVQGTLSRSAVVPGCHCEVVATGRVGMRMAGEGGRSSVGGDPWQPGGRLVTGKLFWEAPSQ
ncbi:hypothetical protein E2C01_056962 [Portunus trituberculatus]|uniref:Uncharacterized protein n=1 Tax=Portunus trituberculatus TaxID=210409 RepID=A0A5B7GVJ2_PORTR|nr:hypothetical protein [Portunus trituberculatus]